MSDEIDAANERIDHTTSIAIQQIQNIAMQIPIGYAGECELCGEYTKRLVDGACAPCRDKHKLK